MTVVRKPLPVAKPEDFEGVTLMRLRTESIKAIRLVDITLDGTLTTIGGGNGAGKSSLLDSVKWVIEGKEGMQSAPITNGKQEGFILADFGDGKDVKLSVERTIKRVGDDDFTAAATISIPGHVAPSRVQDFLDKLAGKMSFDPMALDRMKPAEQYEAIRKLVVGFDFAKNKLAYDQAFKQRTDVGRDQKREQIAADAIEIGKDAPAEHIDEDALTSELQAAGQKNLDIQTRTANRSKAVEAVEQHRATAAGAPAEIAKMSADLIDTRDRAMLRINEQIKALQAQLLAVSSECDADVARHTKGITDAAAEATAKADALQAKLDAAEPLPHLIDTQVLTGKLADGRRDNRQLADWESQRARKIAHQREADKFAADVEALAAAISDLKSERQQAIENAKLPVEGLGFGDGFITLGNVPWEQASTGIRVDASTAIAMALSPRIKVILVRDGSNLDTKMRERIRERAAEKGYRVLMEVVDDTGSTNVVISDGEVVPK
ncbi:MAG: ATP-binding protein [Stenotrophobium sp.]